MIARLNLLAMIIIQSYCVVTLSPQRYCHLRHGDFMLISPDFRYFFESVTTMVGGSVLLAVCASPIPSNTSS